MTAQPPTPQPRYRNDAVYRSAERLVASRPKRRSWSSPPRTAVFLLGLVCGASVVFLLLFTHSQPRDAIAEAPKAPLSFGEATAPSKPAPEERPTAVALAALPANVSAPAPVSAENSAAPAGVAALPIQPRALSSVGGRGGVATDAPPGWVVAATAKTGLNLRGEIRPYFGQPMQVEFQLYANTTRRTGGAVAGAVIFSDRANSPEPVPLTGSWSDRKIRLHQYQMKPVPVNPSPLTLHHFELQFPADGGSEEITGKWSQGSSESGTLILKSVPALRPEVPQAH